MCTQLSAPIQASRARGHLSVQQLPHHPYSPAPGAVGLSKILRVRRTCKAITAAIFSDTIGLVFRIVMPVVDYYYNSINMYRNKDFGCFI